MRLPVVIHVIGAIVLVFGTLMLAPAVVAIAQGVRHDALGFTLAAALSVALGWLMRSAGRETADDLQRIEGLAVVALTWLLLAHLSAVPFVWAGFGVIDAVFEAMSGLTTTGATTITDFSAFGRGVYFWRALTHWLGGMGVIALFVAVLPRLAIGGRQLFFAEAPGPTDEKVTPQIRKTAAVLWRLYALLTLAQIAALSAAGFSVYDATCHAFATLAAGGFSPHPQSLAGFENPAAEWIIVLFMFLAGSNFALQFRVVRGQPADLWRDEEFRAYTGIVVVSSLLLIVFLRGSGGGLLDTIRMSLFQSLSILTTTGFASVDFQLWNDQAKMVLFVLMFIGGCAGSASGGPKVVRQVLIARYTLLELKRTLHPRAVLPVKLGGRVVAEETMRGVLVFFLFYLLVFAVCSVIVVSLGADLVTGITATIATLGNIGPGFNDVGPMASYATLHPVSKVVLTGAMWIGRLEVLTVLALMRPEVWRRGRW
jgi:trk system potassium uptake protein TrkH